MDGLLLESARHDRRLRVSLFNVGHAAWGQAIAAVCAFVATRLYTELLPQSSFGSVMLLLGCLALLDGIVTMAFNQTLLSLFGRDLSAEERLPVAAALALSAAKWIWIALAVASAPVLVWCAIGHSVWPLAALPIIASYLSLELAKTTALASLLTDRRYKDYSLWVAAEAALGVLSCAGSLVLFHGGVAGFALGFFAGRAASTLLFLRRHHHLRYFRHPAWEAARRVTPSALRYGWPVSAMAPLGWVSAYIDRYILAAVAGTSVVGVYTAITGLVSRPYALSTSVLTNYFRPHLYTSPSVGGRAAVERRWIACAIGVGAIGAGMFLVLGGAISQLALASNYRTGAKQIMVVMAISQTFLIMTHAADNGILASRRSGSLLRLQIAGLILPILLIPLLAAKFGPIGAAAARCGVEASKFGLTFWLSRRVLSGGD